MTHLTLIFRFFLFCLSHISLKGEPIRSQTIHSVKQDHPFVVLIVEKFGEDIQRGERLCTGSLISRNQVLTAADCLKDRNLQSLVAITESTYQLVPNLNVFKISSQKTYKDHEEESRKDGTHMYPEIDDICILELDVFNTNVAPAIISYEPDIPPALSHVMFIGWGPTKNRALPKTARYAIVDVLQKQYCDEFAKVFLPRYRKLLWSNKIFCGRRFVHPAHPIDGDFGGPILYKENKLVGIVIRPRPIPEKVGEQPQEPMVGLRLSTYKDFIIKNLHT